MLPYGAKEIADARRQRKKPAELVLVSLVGPLLERNPVILCGNKDYEWWWVRGLNICVFAREGCCWKKTLTAIAAHRPANLWLWDVFRGQGASVYYLPTEASVIAFKSVADLRYELSFIPFTDYQNHHFMYDHYQEDHAAAGR